MFEQNATFEKNLNALRASHPKLADQLQEVQWPADLTWQETRQPPMRSATIAIDGRTRTLASRHNPADEAQRLADTADPDNHGCIVVLGFALGYHVEALIKQAKQTVIVAYEPDIDLLRAVLEQIDYSELFYQQHFVLFAGEVEASHLTARLQRQIRWVTHGVQFLTHPVTRQMHSQALNQFSELFQQFVAYCRTTMATTLVNAPITTRNQAMNLRHYAAGPNCDPLQNAAAGYPAVLVAAGPSLKKNIDQLCDPAVREKVILITVQTALKPLLARGIRPDFVTALDYHPISQRFYENLPDLPDVTLVFDSKGHPQIRRSFPGPVRTFRNDFLDALLGEHTHLMQKLPSGSTVAHLSLYLAQYLGCNPIIMLGQDLGFSLGLYYCPGTAIHEEWASELNPFNSLEMMEWRRITRHKKHLRQLTDTQGQTMYSDEQMITYLKQFERDFDSATQQIIDASEGGVPKRHTTVMPLAEALSQYAIQPVPALPDARDAWNAQREKTAAEVLEQRIADVEALRDNALAAAKVLRKMKRDQHNKRKMDQYFDQLDTLQHRTHVELAYAFKLVNDLNQIGAFQRAKLDRQIHRDEELDEMQRQLRQIERDLENMNWLDQACGELLDILVQSREEFANVPASATSEHREVRHGG